MPLAEKLLRLNPDKIPDLQWSLVDSYCTTNIGLTIFNTMAISTNYIDVNTLSYAKGDKCKKWCGVSMLYKAILNLLYVVLLNVLRIIMESK